MTAELRSPAPTETTARRLGRYAARVAVRGFPRRFGMLEVMALGSVEWMRRHLAIVNAMEARRESNGKAVMTVLDFGGANGSLARALRLYGLADAYRIVLVDIDAEAIEAADTSPPVEAASVIEPDGSLPFPDDSFDLVVSSDVFEHIPAASRSRWANELRRVARFGQIHSVPADSDDGRWISTRVDREYDQWFRDRFGMQDRWTAEHIETGVPSVESLRELFGDCRIDGISNAEGWLAAMQAQQGSKSPASRLRFALRYYRRLRQLEGRPPFKNCLIVVEPAGWSAQQVSHDESASVR